MKRFFIYAVLALIPASIQAEDLQFVTTLSSPLGTFSQLETADPTTAAVSPVVNFCNTRTSTGRIELRGANAYLQNLTLKNGTTLGVPAEQQLECEQRGKCEREAAVGEQYEFIGGRQYEQSGRQHLVCKQYGGKRCENGEFNNSFKSTDEQHGQQR